MGKVIDLNEFSVRKEQERLNAEEEEYTAIERMVKEVMEANPPKPAEPIFLWDEQEAQDYLKASNLDIAIMKLMDAVVLLDSCGKELESKAINSIAGKLLGIEDYE